MTLVFDARPGTKDAHAVFQAAPQTREAMNGVAETFPLREDRLNEAVKSCTARHPQKIFLNLFHIKIHVPEADCLLAMDALAARVKAAGKGESKFLIQWLHLQTPQEVFAIVEKYYPRQHASPQRNFLFYGRTV